MCVCICVYVIQSRICMSRVKAPQSLLLAGRCCVESFRLHISIVKAIQLIGLLLLYYHLVIFFFFKKEKQTLLCEFIELHPPEGNELKFLREFIYFFFFSFFSKLLFHFLFLFPIFPCSFDCWGKSNESPVTLTANLSAPFYGDGPPTPSAAIVNTPVGIILPYPPSLFRP